MGFLHRERELILLQKEFEKKGFRMTVIYGRRRVGKSELIKEFIKDKKSVYYTATKSGIERNVEMMGKQVLASLSEESTYVRFSGIESLFMYLYEKGKKEKIVIVIDEIPYLAEADKGILSVIQSYIDILSVIILPEQDICLKNREIF